MTPLSERTRLNLGCGRRYRADCLNVDLSPDVGADLVHDLDHTPWPLESRRFEEVFVFDVIEHVQSVVSFLDEVHRVCVAGAQVHITVPHFSSANSFSDPTHRRHMSSRALDYLEPDHAHSFYRRGAFQVASRQIVFSPNLKGKIANRIAKRSPNFYESNLAWLMPAWFIYFQLVTKP
jgi:hypothetical protein